MMVASIGYPDGRLIPTGEMKFHMQGYLQGNPASEVYHIMQASKTLRLISLALQDRHGIGTTLETTMAQDLEKWPAAYRDELNLWKASEPANAIKKTGWSTHDILREKIEESTYVMGEIGYWEGLKGLVETYKKQRTWVEAAPEDKYQYIPQCPVPPPMSLYAMHLMIVAYPDSKLSENAIMLKKEYLTWAAAHLPTSTEYRVVAKEVPELAAEPAPAYPVETVHEWPTAFKDGKEMMKYDSAPYVTDESKEWSKLIEGFAAAAIADPSK